MAVSNREANAATAAERVVKCAYCKDPIAGRVGAESEGVCKLCAAEVEEFGWRTLYDREHNIGQIPANLRAAYKL